MLHPDPKPVHSNHIQITSRRAQIPIISYVNLMPFVHAYLSGCCTLQDGNGGRVLPVLGRVCVLPILLVLRWLWAWTYVGGREVRGVRIYSYPVLSELRTGLIFKSCTTDIYLRNYIARMSDYLYTRP